MSDWNFLLFTTQNDNNMMRAKLNLTFQKIQFNISNIILYKAPVKCFKDS